VVSYSLLLAEKREKQQTILLVQGIMRSDLAHYLVWTGAGKARNATSSPPLEFTKAVRKRS
jgi:hypothetical protein